MHGILETSRLNTGVMKEEKVGQEKEMMSYIIQLLSFRSSNPTSLKGPCHQNDL